MSLPILRRAAACTTFLVLLGIAEYFVILHIHTQINEQIDNQEQLEVAQGRSREEKDEWTTRKERAKREEEEWITQHEKEIVQRVWREKTQGKEEPWVRWVQERRLKRARGVAPVKDTNRTIPYNSDVQRKFAKTFSIKAVDKELGNPPERQQVLSDGQPVMSEKVQQRLQEPWQRKERPLRAKPPSLGEDRLPAAENAALGRSTKDGLKSSLQDDKGGFFRRPGQENLPLRRNLRDSPQSREPVEPRDRPQSREPRDRPQSREPVEPRDSPQSREPVEPRDRPQSREPVEPRDRPQSREPVEPRDRPQSREPVEPRDRPQSREPVEPRDRPQSREPVEPRDRPQSREPVEPRDRPQSRRPVEPRDRPQSREPVEPRDRPQSREPVEPRDRPQSREPVEPRDRPQSREPVEPRDRPQSRRPVEPRDRPQSRERVEMRDQITLRYNSLDMKPDIASWSSKSGKVGVRHAPLQSQGAVLASRSSPQATAELRELPAVLHHEAPEDIDSRETIPVRKRAHPPVIVPVADRHGWHKPYPAANPQRWSSQGRVNHQTPGQDKHDDNNDLLKEYMKDLWKGKITPEKPDVKDFEVIETANGPKIVQKGRPISPEILVELDDTRPYRLLSPEEEQGGNIMFTLRTTASYHKKRLPILMETWMTTVDGRNIFVVTDGWDQEMVDQLKKLGVHYIVAYCGNSHKRDELCCKAGVELGLMFASTNMKYDWLCHIDDDMYIIMNPLIQALSKFDPKTEPVYFGRSGSPWVRPRKVQRFSKLGTPGKGYHFAVGGMYCLSRAMLEEARPYLVGGQNFANSCSNTLEPEDVTVGFIVDVVLKHSLSRTELINTHGLHLMSYVDPNNLRKQIAISYGFGSSWSDADYMYNVIYVPGALFPIDQDVSQFRSLHCHLYPDIPWCIARRDRMYEHIIDSDF